MQFWNPYTSPGPDAPADGNPIVRETARHALHRVLAFTRRSIDDVINDPIARNEVLGYYKLHKQVERSMEITELERQWNALG
jgi:hypothetical protein